MRVHFMKVTKGSTFFIKLNFEHSNGSNEFDAKKKLPKGIKKETLFRKHDILPRIAKNPNNGRGVVKI